MSALGFGTFASISRPLFEFNKEPLMVSSIVGLSSINGSPYSPGGGGEAISSFQTASISSLSVSSINGALPGSGGSNFPSGLQTPLITGVSSINGNYPSVVATKDGPEPVSGVITQFGSLSFSGPTAVELNTQYKAFMRVFLTPTQNDGTPDGLYYYTNEGGSSLSSFTVQSTGSNTNVEISWMTIGW